MTVNTPVEQVNRILDIINAAHGTEFRLLSRFSTGEWGAYRIAQPDGQSAVLKFVTDLRDTNIVAPNPHLPGRITDRLRTLGYPTPRYLLAGRLHEEGLYWVQEQLPGEPLWVDSTVEQVEQLIGFLKLQRNQSVSKEQNLSQLIKAVLLKGRGGMTDKLKNHSDETRTMLDDAMDLAEGAADLPLPDTDIVHGDFSYHQAMVEDGRIAGIIDWQEAGCGDWLIDLTRLIYSLHDRPMLAAPIMKELSGHDTRRIKVYTAFTAVEMVAWPVHQHDRDVATGSMNKARSALRFARAHFHREQNEHTKRLDSLSKPEGVRGMQGRGA